MPRKPKELWSSLSPELQTQIIDDISSVIQEVIDEQLRTSNARTPGSKSRHLHQLIEPASSSLQSGKSPYTVRSQRAGPESGVPA